MKKKKIIKFFKYLWKLKSIRVFVAIILSFIGFMLMLYSLIFIISFIFPVHLQGFAAPVYSYVDKNTTIKGEPVNILIFADESELKQAFAVLNWRESETLSKEGIAKAITMTAEGIPPISPRYFQGNVQDLAYQDPDGNIEQRHHIRLWQIENSSVFYAAASYDSGLDINLKKLIPTHIIAPNIDTERDNLGRTLALELNFTIIYLDNILPTFYHFNGDNSGYYTDGEIIVLTKEPVFQNKISQAWLYIKRTYFKFITVLLRVLGVADGFY